MRQGAFIAVVALLGVLLGGSVAVYAYDASRDDLIAEGVTVAGVDVGGMRTAAARAALEEQVATPLERSLVATYRDRQFRLSAARARVTADVEGMVQEALRESREGNVLMRTARGLTGGTVEAELPARVTYSRRAVDVLVRRVKRALDRPARDARVDPSAAGLRKVSSRNGRAVRAGALKRAVAAELVQPDGDRAVAVRAKVTKPNVTSRELAGRYPYFITIDRGSFSLRFFKRLRHVKSYTIAVGQVGYDTPAGLYHIQNKAVNAAWNVPNKPWAGSLAGKIIPGGAPNNPLKARWMAIYDGAGIHGTDQTGSLGSRASHGCIRMSIPDVKELYDQVPVRTPVYIG
jgi:lipoprotein-anchoring transpeptidase ErfK/SrfK